MDKITSIEAMDDRDFGFMILERLEQNFGTPLRHIFEKETDPNVIRRQMRKAIFAAVQHKAGAEKPSAEWPNAGNVDLLAQYFTSDDVNVVPDVAVTEHNLAVLKGYTGSQIHDYVKGVTNGLSLIKDGQTAGEVAGEIIGSGLAAFAIAMIIGTVKALRAGNAFRAAVTMGVRAMGGVTVVVSVVALIITELLIYLLVNNQKVFLGMVFNDTDLNLQVVNWRNGTGGDDSGDLYMNTGKMTSFMETHENENLDSPFVQMPARSFIAPNDPDNLVMGGIFAAEKNFGFYGTEGVMAFSDLNQATPRYFLLFACPYTMDNGVNVLIDGGDPRSPKSVFDNLYDGRGLDTSSTLGSYTFTARCNSKSGGEAAGIAVLQAPHS
ncbi:MAG TPA: hypothetical protein VI381_02295 [Allosphingosinicella sp.]